MTLEITQYSHKVKEVSVTVVRDREIRTALRTNQIAEFVTVTAWKKIKPFIFDLVTQLQIANDCLF